MHLADGNALNKVQAALVARQKSANSHHFENRKPLLCSSKGFENLARPRGFLIYIKNKILS